MVPLGPCNGKNSATTISPWVVVPEALEPFQVSGHEHIREVIPQLADPSHITYDVTMQVEIRAKGCSDFVIVGCSNLRHLYWTPRQMIAHIVSAGAPLRSGDLMATGTVSGKLRTEGGCLLEATAGGTMPVELTNDEERIFLEDGDEVRLTAIVGDGHSGVGFGECVGTIFPADSFDVPTSS
jgi:fumarylacetoacetase